MPPLGTTNDTKDIYGWSMIATHLAVLAYLFDTRLLDLIVTGEPYCWPYFESCWRWRLPTTAHASLLLLGYLTVVAAATAARLLGWARASWWSLLSANALLFLVISLDYRLRANEFYMLFWINGIYLVGVVHRWTIPVTIISFYFWAGALKLNSEWLSGAGLYGDLWLIPKALTPAACTYVVVLEMILIWGLLARRAWVRVAVLVQLLLFHLQSLSQIHWFYPLLMAAILSWFCIDWSRPGGGGIRLGELFGGRAPGPAYAVVLVFASLQVAPLLYRGDSTLTGQGRVFALHMFEARQQCLVTATSYSPSGEGVTRDLKVRSLPPRMICDPVVYFNRALNLCRSRRNEDPAFDFRLVMQSKRTTEPQFRTIVDVERFCAGGFDYKLLANNVWLR